MNRYVRLTVNLLLSVLLLVPCSSAFAQRVGIKTNLFYGAYTFTPNLAVELGLSGRSTLDVGAGYNPWNLQGSEESNKKLVHLLGAIEYRYWLCEKFNGHFFGAHALGSQYNISEHELPLLFGEGSKDFRYEGWAVGAGLAYGYHFLLGRSWNLEATLGIGYVYLQYDKYECPKCGGIVGSMRRDYFGPTKMGLSLIYLF